MCASRIALVGLVPLAIVTGCSGGDSFNPDGGAALGAAYAQSRGCYQCHQAGTTQLGTLSGQDEPLDGGAVFGSNLTPDPATGLGDWADVEIVRALRAGVDNRGAPLCPAMPRYPDMSDLEAQSIVAFLRSLPPVSHAIPPSRCPPLKPPLTHEIFLFAVDQSASVVDLGAPPDLADGGASD